jgi:hypothetical protein
MARVVVNSLFSRQFPERQSAIQHHSKLERETIMSDTTILNIVRKDTSSGDHDCIVDPRAPLWIRELILCPIENLPAASGWVRPGTQPNGSLRTLCLPSTHPAFRTPAPFSLAVTYDVNDAYKVSAAHVVGQSQAIAALFSRVSDDLSALDPGEQAMFLTQVLQVMVASSLQPAPSVIDGGDGCAPPAGKTKQYATEKGKDRPPPLS